MRRLFLNGLCLLVLLVGAPAWALDPARKVDEYTIARWTMEDGLPHNLVHTISQDADGYVWAGTWEGAARFDGRRFTAYDAGTVPGLEIEGVRAITPHPQGGMVLSLGRVGPGVVRFHQGRWQRLPGQAGTLPDVSVLRFAPDGALWIGTDHSLFRMDPSGRLQDIGSTHERLANERVLAILPLPDGRALVGNRHGLFRIDNGRATDWGRRVGLPDTSVLAIQASRWGGILVGGGAGVWRVERDRPQQVTGERAEAMLEDRNGNLWISTLDGLRRYAQGRYETLGEPNGLMGRLAPSLFEDRDGLLWVGTTNGLYRISDGPVFGLGRSSGLRDIYVRTIIERPGQGVWVGHPMGVDMWQGGQSRPVPLAFDGKTDPSVLSMANARDGGLWIGTYDQGVIHLPAAGTQARPWRIDEAGGLPSNHVRALLERSDGSLWIGSNEGVTVYRDGRIARHYGVEDGLPAGNVYVLYETAQGVLWIGTGNGMAMMRRDGTLQTWKPMSDFPAVAAFDFLADPDGSLWIASDRGLLHWSEGRFVQFDHRQGLPNNRLFRLLEDDNGDFWVSSNRGVFRISRPALTAVENHYLARLPVEAFTHADGLPSSQANGASAPAGWLMRDGKLWFATANGIGVIDPDDARRQRNQGVTLVVEAIDADGRVLPLQTRYTLAADTRRVVIRFTGLNQRASERLRYRYRMVGFDRGWIETDNSIAHDAVYTNLPSGKLRFEVQAMNAPADWSKQEDVVARTVELDKASPWWMRAWAMVAYVLLLGLVGWGVLLLAMRRHRLRQRRLQALVDVRTSELSDKNRLLEQAGEANAQLLEQLAYQARHDPLTRLANRRAGDAFLAEALEVSRREGRPLSVALLDIDHFKAVNDRYGHAFGDEVLSQVAALAEQLAGGRDDVLIARWGGEEFLVCQQLPWSTARARLEALREGIAQASIDAPDGDTLQCTVSIGMAELEAGQDLRDLLRVADERLYRAKQQGRNRLVST
ncbi:ligand-binding sensor domain-containing diguanylate cyclase [Pseudoxanthomonas sp. PXM02]|uniref:two-component regulator propeller domain-containing protein n=1 Tax=Pseudoxanthomonas sp. PXM02 TaxID=2769294 RepID=UPI00177FF6CB